MSAVVPQGLTDAPPTRGIERVFQTVLTIGLGALGFFLPFSTAGTALSLFVLLMLCVATPMRVWRLAPWRDPLVAAGLLLLAYIALRTLIGEGFSRASAAALNRYHELLMVPLLWALMRAARRLDIFVHGLLAGALFLALAFWLEPVLPTMPALQSFLHLRRITAGFAFAVCAFLLFERGRAGEGLPWLNYGVAAFLAVTVVFVNDARTGHVIMLVLLGCAAFRAAPARWRVAAVCGVLVTGVLLAALSPSVRHRIAETHQDALAIGTGGPTNTSTAARIEQLRNGLGVAREHWLVGTGWQGYREAFERVSVLRHPEGVSQVLGATSDNPHNEYLLQLGAGGLPALSLFLLWVGVPLWRAARARPAPQGDWTGAMGAVALAFAAGCLLNSLLLDFGEGHFYGAVLAWLAVRRQQQQQG